MRHKTKSNTSRELSHRNIPYVRETGIVEEIHGFCINSVPGRLGKLQSKSRGLAFKYTINCALMFSIQRA